MCRALRQVCALVLCTGIVLNVRWIPSELDDADRPSRRGLSVPWPPHGGFSGCFPQDRPRRARTRRSVEPAAIVAPLGVRCGNSVCLAPPTRCHPVQSAGRSSAPAPVRRPLRCPGTGLSSNREPVATWPGLAPGQCRTGARRRGIKRAWARGPYVSTGDRSPTRVSAQARGTSGVGSRDCEVSSAVVARDGDSIMPATPVVLHDEVAAGMLGNGTLEQGDDLRSSDHPRGVRGSSHIGRGRGSHDRRRVRWLSRRSLLEWCPVELAS